VACGMACLVRAMTKIPGRTWSRTATASVVVLSCGLGLLHGVQTEESLRVQRPSPADVSSLRSFDVPRRSVVLTNAYTEGYVAEVMGASGLLEGRAPYTYPRVLTRANRLLREARDFFQHPCRNIDFLDRNNVAYVVVTPKGTYALSTRNLVAKHVDPSTLDACPELIRVVATSRLDVFRVER
jgi:hypothetical protein